MPGLADRHDVRKDALNNGADTYNDRTYRCAGELCTGFEGRGDIRRRFYAGAYDS